MKLACKSDGGGRSRGWEQVTSADSWRIRGIEGVRTMEPVFDGDCSRLKSGVRGGYLTN